MTKRGTFITVIAITMPAREGGLKGIPLVKRETSCCTSSSTTTSARKSNLLGFKSDRGTEFQAFLRGLSVSLLRSTEPVSQWLARTSDLLQLVQNYYKPLG